MELKSKRCNVSRYYAYFYVLNIAWSAELAHTDPYF